MVLESMIEVIISPNTVQTSDDLGEQGLTWALGKGLRNQGNQRVNAK